MGVARGSRFGGGLSEAARAWRRRLLCACRFDGRALAHHGDASGVDRVARLLPLASVPWRSRASSSGSKLSPQVRQIVSALPQPQRFSRTRCSVGAGFRRRTGRSADVVVSARFARRQRRGHRHTGERQLGESGSVTVIRAGVQTTRPRMAWRSSWSTRSDEYGSTAGARTRAHRHCSSRTRRDHSLRDRGGLCPLREALPIGQRTGGEQHRSMCRYRHGCRHAAP